MKKAIALLCILLLLCPQALAEMDPNVLGEWETYAIVWGESVTTRADIDSPDGFVVNADGTLDFTENGEVYAQGSWTWEDGEYDALHITDDAGVNAAFVFMNGMLFSIAYFENGELFNVYYKPDAPDLISCNFQDSAWNLEYRFADGRRVSMLEAKNSYMFTLNQDGSASILSAYDPQNGQWTSEGYSLQLQTDWGARLDLEMQFDGSLYGLYTRGETSYPVEFEPMEPFAFYPAAASLSDLEGTWRMTHARDELLFDYSREELTFDYTLTLSGDRIILEFDGEENDFTAEYAASIVDGPILEESDAGAILRLTDADGLSFPAWLQTDGSLFLRNPSSLSFYFERQ